MIYAEVEVSPSIALIYVPIEEGANAAGDEVADLVEEKWRQMADATRSVRTGRYRASIHVDRRAWLEAGGRIWDVVADARHSTIVEEVLEPVPGFLPNDSGPGRYPAKLTTEAVEADVILIVDKHMQEAVDKINRG